MGKKFTSNYVFALLSSFSFPHIYRSGGKYPFYFISTFQHFVSTFQHLISTFQHYISTFQHSAFQLLTNLSRLPCLRETARDSIELREISITWN